MMERRWVVRMIEEGGRLNCNVFMSGESWLDCSFYRGSMMIGLCD